MSSDFGQVEAVVLRSRCPSCKGRGLVPGGQREYDELVACHHCRGAKTIEQQMPMATFVEMLRAALAGKVTT